MLDIGCLEHQGTAPTPRPQSCRGSERDEQPKRGRPMATDLLDRVRVDPHVRQRTRDQRQSPGTEDDPHVQTVENLQHVDVLGVAATPGSPQIAQSLQAGCLSRIS